MKKIVHLLSIILLSLYLSSSCGQAGKQSDEPTSGRQSNDSNSCLITENQGIGMVENYQAKYAENCGDYKTCGLLQQGWVSKEVVAAMTKLLNDGSGIDGYRIYFTAEETNSQRFAGNDHKKGISFAIVPTRPDTSTRDANSNSIHIDIWGRLIPIDNTTGHTLNTYINIDKERANILRQQFDSIYRKEYLVGQTVDSLSKSVWYEKDCILQISKYVLKNSSTGLALVPGAYRRRQESAKYDNQSTAILVTTKNGQELDWKEHQKSDIASIDMAPYNHGELCPQKCPPPGH